MSKKWKCFLNIMQQFGTEKNKPFCDKQSDWNKSSRKSLAMNTNMEKTIQKMFFFAWCCC